MRVINFLIIFLFCVALVLFSLENTDPATIKVVKGVDIQAPLCIELIGAMGLGGLVAWIFSILTQFQRFLESRKTTREIMLRENRIQALEKDLEQYKAELQEQQQAPKSATEATEVKNNQPKVTAQS
jgi:lipopolysaccharide assembly protein A